VKHERSIKMNIQPNQNYAIETMSTAKLGEKVVTVWRAMKVNSDSVFMAKVGKDGSLLKPNASNMMTVPFAMLKQGAELGNFYAV
jgi:hypothetical protein